MNSIIKLRFPSSFNNSVAEACVSPGYLTMHTVRRCVRFPRTLLNGDALAQDLAPHGALPGRLILFGLTDPTLVAASSQAEISEVVSVIGGRYHLGKA